MLRRTIFNKNKHPLTILFLKMIINKNSSIHPSDFDNCFYFILMKYHFEGPFILMSFYIFLTQIKLLKRLNSNAHRIHFIIGNIIVRHSQRKSSPFLLEVSIFVEMLKKILKTTVSSQYRNICF